MFCDIGLSFDPARRCCDITIAGGDIVLDRTPVTAMLVALGSDARARPDDELPSGDTDLQSPAALNPRRGWIGDAVLRKINGTRRGSLLWLLERAKKTEDTRRRAQDYALEALREIEARTRCPVETRAAWAESAPGVGGVLRLVARVGKQVLTVRVATA